MKKLFLLTATAAFLAACSNDSDNLAVNNSDELVPLQVSGNINVKVEMGTRANNVSWSNGDHIGIIGVPANTTPTKAENTTVYNGNAGDYNTTVTTATTYSAPATFTATTPVYLPANGSAIDVYGYYPYNSGDFDPTAVPANVNATQTTTDAYYSSDFMRAYNNQTAINTSTGEPTGSIAITKANYSTVLNFKHKLTKLVFNISKDADGMYDTDIAAISSVTISGQPTTATYNIYENGVASATNPLNITDNTPETITACNTVAASSGSATYEAIVYPNKMTSEGVALTNNAAADRTVTITIGTSPNATYTFTIPSGTVLLSGYQYTYTVTIKPAKLEVTAAISPWTSAGAPVAYNAE